MANTSMSIQSSWSRDIKSTLLGSDFEESEESTPSPFTVKMVELPPAATPSRTTTRDEAMYGILHDLVKEHSKRLAQIEEHQRRLALPTSNLSPEIGIDPHPVVRWKSEKTEKAGPSLPGLSFLTFSALASDVDVPSLVEDFGSIVQERGLSYGGLDDKSLTEYLTAQAELKELLRQRALALDGRDDSATEPLDEFKEDDLELLKEEFELLKSHRRETRPLHIDEILSDADALKPRVGTGAEEAKAEGMLSYLISLLPSRSPLAQ